jgi:hypothetical protein
VCLCAGVSLVVLLPGTAIGKKKHPRCPKGQVQTKHGCQTPLSKFLVTYRSSNHQVVAQLGPNKFGNSEIRFSASEAYPYQHPCAGPTLTGAIAGPILAGFVPIKTKTAYVGTTFSGKLNVGGGTQLEAGGVRSVLVTVTTSGKVLSAKTLTGTVTIAERREFGPTQASQTTYTTCGSSFSFKLHRYVGAFPGPA